MDVTSIVILIIIALFTGLFLLILHKKGQIKKVTGALLFALVMVILTVTGWHFSRVSFSLLNEKSNPNTVIAWIMEQIPSLKALQQYDLPEFNTLNAMVKQSMSQGKTARQATDQIRAAIINFSVKRMTQAPDDDVNQFYIVTLAQLDELKARKANGYDLCFNYLFHQEDEGINFLDYSTSGLLQRQLNTAGRIVTNSYLHPHKSTAEEQAQAEQQLKSVVQQLKLTYGDDLFILIPPVSNSVNHEKACNITYDLYQRILALPPAESASIIRYIMKAISD